MRLLASPTPKQQLQMKKVILYIFTIQWQIHKTNISIDQINQRPSWKNVHTVLGIRTWGRWMEGPDENHPSTRWKVCLFLSSTFVSNFGSLANVMTPDESNEAGTKSLNCTHRTGWPKLFTLVVWLKPRSHYRRFCCDRRLAVRCD